MVYYTIYTSTSNSEITSFLMDQITIKSQEYNSSKGITGMLIGYENKFLQYLEGDRKEVIKLMDSIKRDPRHRDVREWVSSTYKNRIFAEWTMGSWMLSSNKIAKLSALQDLKNFLNNPDKKAVESWKFLTMMHNLLESWITVEPEQSEQLKN